MARRSSGVTMKHPSVAASVAERAYFKSEQRGFAPGRELDDWLAAERELMGGATPAAKPRKATPRRKNGAVSQ